MRFVATAIANVTLVELDIRRDDRGGFARTFCGDSFAAAGHAFTVVQANLSLNPHSHTLRGLHFQRAPHGEPKIVMCGRGRIWDVAVDARPASSTYRTWQAFELTPDNGRMLLLGEGIAHGFITLEPDSDVHYLMGAPYVAEAASGWRWNDPALAIEWPAVPAVISERDAEFALL